MWRGNLGVILLKEIVLWDNGESYFDDHVVDNERWYLENGPFS